MNLKLNDRVEEIAEAIPKRIRPIILNAVIAKSVENGELFRELSYYLSIEEVEKIAEQLSVNIAVKSGGVRRRRKNVIAERITSEAEGSTGRKRKEKLKDPQEDLDLFIGFDD